MHTIPPASSEQAPTADVSSKIYLSTAEADFINAMRSNNGVLTATYSVSPTGVSYSGISDFQLIAATVAEWVDDGLLTRHFFDRLFVCDRCFSHRVHVREECIECRSADISEHRIIHHFRCAYQGAEDDFLQPDGQLVCPKCIRELRHYGSDHEASGRALKCAACGFSGSDAVPGFVCHDCGAHSDAERMSTRTYYHYRLTPAGVARLEQGTDNANPGIALLAAGCPPELVGWMVSALRKHEDFALAELTYPNFISVQIAEGVDVANQARTHLLGTLRARLWRGVKLSSYGSSDYVFMPNATRARVVDGFNTVLSECSSQLRVDLGTHVKLLERSDFQP